MLLKTVEKPLNHIGEKHEKETMTKEYIEINGARQMYTFNNSSHTPFLEEQERFYNIMQDDVLNILKGQSV